MSSASQKASRATSRKSNNSRKSAATDMPPYGSSSESDSDATLPETQPDDLDEPWPFTFSSGDAVWVRSPTNHNWFLGHVASRSTRAGMTREKEGVYYCVQYRDGCRIRNYFSPLNGDMKPDSRHVQQLLKEAGCI
ncbi:hypothetical protein PLICRDRAFT_172090 [Plicaturopsis crispa FD-325 SS-3]|nr:hypothetical protein PLICRDRAFT_172090 [Plicaturopsis crispa FD-325 SS-3]